MATKKTTNTFMHVTKRPVNIMEQDLTYCYELNGITYLPHYSEPVFVGPGYGRANFTHYTALQLIAHGATLTERMLWPRPKSQG